MKKILYFILFFATSSYCLAQPDWFDSDERSLRYPIDTYFIGFVQNNYNSKQQDISIKEIKDKANSALIESIYVSIESQKELFQSENISNGNSKTASDYKINIKTDSKINLPNLKTEYYIDKTTNTIYGFAHIKKYDLCSFYSNEISEVTKSVTSTISQIEVYTTQDEVYKIYPNLIKTKQCIEQQAPIKKMLLLTCDSSDYNKKIETLSQLQDTINHLISSYDKKILVYFTPNSSSTIVNDIKTCIESQGCAISNSQESANLLFDVNVTLKQHAYNNEDFSYTYAKVTFSITDVKNQKDIFNKEITAKGGGINDDSANDNAIQNATKEICESLNKELFN